jgi:APA family basic amino acid/polyamine antiporter
MSGEPASRLSRRLTTTDAVVIGLGSMIGAGIFAALGPAAAAAGAGLLIALALAGAVAFCNATSSAQLAAIHPLSGGTYVYARRELGRPWGALAGWAFVIGKVASCATMALTFGRYAWPSADRVLAVAAVVVFTAVNVRGVGKTVGVTRWLVAAVLAALAAVVVGCLFGGQADAGNLSPLWPESGLHGVLQAGAVLFYAFAGYARIATLGEEVRNPARTIPRAIPIALFITLGVYVLVATSALLALGPAVLAAAKAPLAEAVRAGSLNGLAGVVRVGGAVASLAVLIALLAGVGRTVFAMASDGELPRALAAVHPRWRVPHRAEIAVGLAVTLVAALGGLTATLAVSAFTVLVYYLITNFSAVRLGRERRRWPLGLAVGGIVGCVVLAANLPWRTIFVGTGLLGLAMVGHAVAARRMAPEGPAVE